MIQSKRLLNAIRAGITIAAVAVGQSAFAQATTTTTPGTPTTALGGMAGSNIVTLIFSLSLIGIGIMIARKRNSSHYVSMS